MTNSNATGNPHRTANLGRHVLSASGRFRSVREKFVTDANEYLIREWRRNLLLHVSRLDPSRPEIAIRRDAMLRAREVVAARSWSTSQEADKRTLVGRCAG